jgi:ATP-dependent Clp protease protease subunit
MEEKIMKESKDNIVIAVGITALVISVMIALSSLSKVSTPLSLGSDKIVASTVTETPVTLITNLTDKKVPTTTLNPVVSENTKPLKVVKNIKALKLSKDRTINIFGPISANAHEAAAMIRSMNYQNTKEPIFIVLYSPGGSVVDGAALISAMQVSEAPVHTVCYTFCASMAAMIHQYGAQRYITDRSILMFHPASFGTEGEVDKMFSQISMIRRYINKIEMEVATRMSLSFTQYKTLTANEYWIDSEDSLRANASDQIVYLVPTGLPSKNTIFSETEDKKELEKKNDKGLKDLQWIY